MSVQMIENWSELEGEVRSIQPDPELEGFEAVQLAVWAAKPVEGYPNLLEGVEGSDLEVLFPQVTLDELGVSPGSRIVVQVRRAGLRRIFAHRERVVVRPDWGESDAELPDG